MNARTFIAAALIIFSLLFSSAAIAGANGADVSGKTLIQQEVFLCFEPVIIDGWFLMIGNTRTDRAGGLHVMFQNVFHGTGVGGYTGTQYQWIGSNQSTVTLKGDGSASTFVERLHLISQGRLVNNHIWLTAHLTATPDGTITVDWTDFFCEYF